MKDIWGTNNNVSCDLAVPFGTKSTACGRRVCLLATVNIDPADLNSGTENEINCEIIFELGSDLG